MSNESYLLLITSVDRKVLRSPKVGTLCHRPKIVSRNILFVQNISTFYFLVAIANFAPLTSRTRSITPTTRP
jgi:hypothetical protein